MEKWESLLGVKAKPILSYWIPEDLGMILLPKECGCNCPEAPSSLHSS